MQELLEILLATKKVLDDSRPAVSPDALIGVVYFDQFPPDVFRCVLSEPLEQGMTWCVCLTNLYPVFVSCVGLLLTPSSCRQALVPFLLLLMHYSKGTRLLQHMNPALEPEHLSRDQDI